MVSISHNSLKCCENLSLYFQSVGRPKGRKNTITKLTGKEELIENLLAQNIQKTKIAEMLNVDYKTLYTYLKQKAE